MSESEFWKPIPGHEAYLVSSLGRFKNATTNRTLNPWKNRKGYFYVSLGSKTKKEVHYFVAITFLGPRSQGKEVNHKDGDKSNNCASNLEWVTRSQNVKHAFDNKLNYSGSKHGQSKLIESQVIEIKQLLKNKQKGKPPFYQDIAKAFNVDRKTIELS